ncbi:Arylsulfatase [Thalassoglobus neptunius]|uniref:Arylsulfatase n=1 Tax=Thalassoglobus neptunius TaxID=1938619 RepID=A0A5C5VY26_9PLAN|nr:sulfatase-like hydrolase/transferase [Thalassoglobus neptunius]TWT43037.1 Arylsulfatase [Thalassoglobus neptunius]
MNRLSPLFAFFLLIGQALPAQGTDKNPTSQPNIIYIMADELGYYELGCMGSTQIETPNIDRMAKEGILFTNARAGSSVCAPTRCCLMTGLHSGHTSVRSNGGGTPLRAEEQTVASLLHDHGYATGGFGKWGCGGRGSTGVPEDHGFDIFLGYYDQVHAHSYYPPYIIKNSEEVLLENNHGLSEGETYSHYVIMDEGLEFLKKNKDRPFFAYFPITPPHGLFDIPDSDPAWQIYKDRDWPESAKRYAAMVTMVDRNVGEVLELVQKLGLDEKTLIFFSGDNGGNDYFKDAEHPRGFFGANVHPETGVEFRGTKGTLYEGGLRIPMIARWPGHIAPNRVSDLRWYFPDLLPTACDVAGLPIPKDIDGISILPELLGDEQPQHEFLYWEIGNQTAVLWNDWKTFRARPNAEWELYNLKSDPSEESNVADEHPEVLKQMVAMAESAHTPVVEGTFFNRDLHEKDRRAKFGNNVPSKFRSSPVKHDLDRRGLVDAKSMKVIRFSSQAEGNSKLAQHAIDGDPATHWHSEFQPVRHEHPHELVIDLGQSQSLTGVRYLARQDGGWNGSVKEFDLFISDDPDSFGAPVLSSSFEKTKNSQELRFPESTGRYVLLRTKSAINDGPWASISEIGFLKSE